MSSALKADIHLGPNYTEILEVYKNTNFEEIQSLFGITQKLILYHSEEILNVKQIESTAPSWKRSTLSHDQVIKWTQKKSTCILRLRTMSGKVVRSFRSKPKMGRPGNRWRFN